MFYKSLMFLSLLCGYVISQDKVVAHWSFDSSSQGSFSDVSGNGYTAISTRLNVADGVSGKAVVCDSSAFDIYVANSVGNFELPKFTFEGWIYSENDLVNPGSFNNYKKIFEYARCGMEGSGDGGGFALHITDNGKLEFAFANPTKSPIWTTVTSDLIFNSKKWYHVAATYDGSMMKIYINGKLVKETAHKLGFLPSNIPARIGCQLQVVSGTEGNIRTRFTGMLDEFKLYNYALNNSSIVESFNAHNPYKEQLIAHWSFDSTSQGNFPDVTGNGYTAISTRLNVADGVSGKAVVCDSSAFDIQVANSVGNFELPKFTFEGWVYSEINLVNPGSFNNYKKIFDYARVGMEGSGDGGGFGLHITDKGKLEFCLANPTKSPTWMVVTSDSTLQPRRWYHIAATYDGLCMKIFINGNLAKEKAYTLGFLPSNIPARIGCELQITSGGQGNIRTRFIGKIDEFKLYNYALDEQVLLTAYNNLKPSEEPQFEINFGMKTTYAQPGDTVVMPVFITNFEDYAISACQFAMKFDSRIAELISISKDSGIISNWPLFSYNPVKADSINIAAAGGSTPIKYGEGEFVRCIFKVKPDVLNYDTCNISLHNISIDEKFNLIKATNKNGKIIISKSNILYGDVTGNGKVNLFDAQKVLSYVVNSLILPDSTCPNFTIAVADVSGNGSVTSYDAALIFQHSIGLLPEFPVAISNKKYLQKWAMVNSAPIAKLTTTVKNIGDELRCTITGSNLKGFIAGEISIAFDPSVVNPARGSISTMVKGATLKSKVDPDKNLLKVAIVTNDDIDENEPVTLLNITLPPATGNTEKAFSICGVLINEGKIPTNIGTTNINYSSMKPDAGSQDLKIVPLRNCIKIYTNSNLPLEISIWTLNGKSIIRKLVNSTAETMLIDIDKLSPGSYIYRINRGLVSQRGVFVKANR